MPKVYKNVYFLILKYKSPAEYIKIDNAIRIGNHLRYWFDLKNKTSCPLAIL